MLPALHREGGAGMGHGGQPVMPRDPAPIARCNLQSFKIGDQRSQEWLCVTGGQH